MSVAALLAALRAGGSPSDHARARLATDPALRAEVVAVLAGTVQPGDHALAVWLLRQETADLAQRGISSATESLYTLVALVARFRQPEDALLIWWAREATPETREGLDVEQMARAGLEAVRRVLERLKEVDEADAQEATAALAWLAEGEREGAFTDLPGYFSWSDARFGLEVFGPT